MMNIIQDLGQMRDLAAELRCQKKSIGFVPTMGALHEGHLQLIKAAAAQNDVVVCSIFVNPTQFNNPEDYRLYPRLPEHDIALLESAACDVLFVPDAAAMYVRQPKMQVSFGSLDAVMEGAHRPGHFSGVATVVSKLFHLVQPHRAYFGQKDLQQYAVIRQMVSDLSFDVELVCHPVVREEDGLAMSSRNRRLTPQHRAVAPQLYQALLFGKNLLHSNPVEQVREAMEEQLNSIPEIKLEYVDVVNAHTLQPLQNNETAEEIAICLAAHLGDVRLIDNLVIKA